jgi:hypothetical protein
MSWRASAFGFAGRDLRTTDICKPVQPSINAAFEAEPPSSPVQPDASKWKVLAVSLLYTEVVRRETPPPALLSVREVADASASRAEPCTRFVKPASWHSRAS